MGEYQKLGNFLGCSECTCPRLSQYAHIVLTSRYMGEGVGGEVVHITVSNLLITLFVSL